MQRVELPKKVVQAWGKEAARDFMAWLEERLRVVQLSPQVQVSAFVARQKVNVLMLEQVSNLLLAGEPTLVQTADGSWMWRVSVDLTFPSHGRVGCVGEVNVDARYGEVHYDDALLARIVNEAQQLTQQTLHPAK
jgi:hypothetical protein